RGADEEIGEVESGFAAVKGEISVRSACVALIDLQIAGLATEFHGVFTHDFREAIGEQPGVVWLESSQRGNADGKAIEVNRRHGLRKARRTRRNNTQCTGAGHEAE